MSDTLLIRNGTVLTLGKENRVLPGHSLLCENGAIRKIAPDGVFSGTEGRVIDAGGKIVLPGWINSHMHFYSTLVRGLGKAEPADDFSGVLRNLWWRLDKALTLDDCYESALIMLLTAIRQGTTTLVDHHASPRAVNGALDAIAGAVMESGLRACLCYEVSDRDGEPAAREGIEENARFIRRCQSEKNERLRGLFGLHASFTLSEATLERSAALGRELNTGFHIHVAEAGLDQEHCRNHFGIGVVERLQRHGILGRQTLAAHCVHVDEGEMDLLAETETMVAHNPQSNLNNAVGIADVIMMRKKGIVVGLGTDAMTVNMLEELRVALWAQRHFRKDPSCGFAEVTSALTEQNPRIATRLWGTPLGWIGEGAAADLILVDYEPPTPLDDGTAMGHLLYGISQSPVDTTIVGGRVLMENGELSMPIDEERIAARARERAAALWRRF